MKSIGEAMREIAGCFEPTGVARQPIVAAVGSALAEDLIAGADLPAFDNSAMDGYALRHADLALQAALRVHGESRAGGAWPPALPPGCAMRIFTGAPLPAGADTVAMQENAVRSGDEVRFDPVPHLRANVRARGSDLRAGAVALVRGQRLGPGEIALLAAQGQHAASVYRTPRVAIVSTGDELREIGEDRDPGTLVNSNAYALAALVHEAGAEPWVLPIAGDREQDVAARLRQALRADVVISTGGVSVGEYDVVGKALAHAGVDLRFWKVAVKPGKPVMFGMAGRVPVVALPGNPVSAMVTFELFVKPGLRRMAGHTAPYPALLRVELEHDHTHTTGRLELARASLRAGADGRLFARVHTHQSSGSLPSMCGADALLVLDADVERFAAGQRLPALPLRPLVHSADPPLP
jgi:molybdopterin molybdotransferase